MDDNIAAYCSLDKDGRRPDHELTLQEKEQLFIEAMAVSRAAFHALHPARSRSLACDGLIGTRRVLVVGPADVVPPPPRQRRNAERAWSLPRASCAPPLQAFYYDQEPVLSDSEFDNLKQELQWEGSKVVVLT